MNDNNYIDFVGVGNKGAASHMKDHGEYVGSVATLVV